MTQFGTPRRNATSDANAGIVNPPAKRHTARTQTPQTARESTLSAGISSFGQSMGIALQDAVTEERANILEQRQLDATIRQNQDHAINTIDAEKKRTGWSKGMFGQNVEYRAAQQRAVQNNVTDNAVRMATELDANAYKTPEQYAKALKGTLDDILKEYPDDPETRRLATNAWLVHAGKLTAGHQKNHFAFNQQQNRETVEKSIQKTFESWTVYSDLLTSQDEAKTAMNEYQMFFEGVSKPTDMDDVAWRGAVNNQLALSLREGNIGPYRAAVDNGWIGKLNAEESVAMNAALNVYEGKYKEKVNLAYETAEMAALAAATPEEAVVAYDNLITSLNVLGTRATGSVESMQSLTQGSYKQILGDRESKGAGGYRAKNQLGYIGRYQFGTLALRSIGYKDKQGNWTGKDGVNSEEDWFNNKEAQDSAVIALANQNRRTLQNKGSLDFVGKVFNGVRVTEQGLLAASHLVGAGAVNKMLKSGKIPQDANGTTALEYMKLFEHAVPTSEDQTNEEVRDELVGLDDFASGSEESLLTRTQTTTRAQKARGAILKNLEDYRARLEKETAKKMATLERNNALKEAIRSKNTKERAGVFKEYDAEKKELEEILDVTIVEDVNRMVASDKQLNSTDAVHVMMTQPTIADYISGRLKTSNVGSPLVKRAVETFISGYQGHLTEKGGLNEEGRLAMQSIAQFAKNKDSFRTMVGQTNYDRYEILQRGMYLGHTAEMIQKHTDAYMAHKGNREKYNVQWGLDVQAGETKKSRISSLIERFTGKVPTPTSLAHYQEEYERALIIYQGDRGMAEDYLHKSAMNAALNYKGRVIEGGKYLNDVTKYAFDDLLDGAQMYIGDGASLMTPYLKALNPPSKDGKEDESIYPRTLRDRKNVEMYVVDGIDGFFLDSLNAQAPINISSDTMKRWERKLKERNNFKQMLEERKHGKKVRDILAQREQTKLFK